jgi:hypothetical protein
VYRKNGPSAGGAEAVVTGVCRGDGTKFSFFPACLVPKSCSLLACDSFASFLRPVKLGGLALLDREIVLSHLAKIGIDPGGHSLFFPKVCFQKGTRLFLARRTT